MEKDEERIIKGGRGFYGKDGTKKAIRKIKVPYKYPSSEEKEGS